MLYNIIPRRIVFSLACGLSAAGCLAIAGPASAQQVKAYHQWTAPFEYNGPARSFNEQEQNPKTLRIGILASLSGGGAEYGIAMKEGADMARDEINARGGIKGTPLELIYRDDRNDMGENGHQTVKLLFDDKVLAIIGSVHSGCTHVAARITLKAETAQLTTVSTDPTVQMIGSPWMFRCLADDRAQGAAIADLVFGKSGHKRVGLFQQKNRYGKMGGKTIAHIAETRGSPLIFKQFFEPGQSDFSNLMEMTAIEKPEAVIIWGLYSEGAALVKALRASGYRGAIYGADGMVSQKFIDLAGEAAEGTIVTYPFDDTRTDPVTQKFIADFQKIYGKRPDSFAAHAYDAVYMMARAIERGGTIKVGIRDALAATRDFPGVTGPISFNEYNDDGRPVIFAKVTGGRFVPLSSAGQTGR
ncbi:MAG TPA: ABC transporter substrate-binding protein [Candidatus Ozemobacteraceae bacterium]|nr:ABC transporter substrate-binding protein [Candidatus Ozemobacteraceae bacterium]